MRTAVSVALTVVMLATGAALASEFGQVTGLSSDIDEVELFANADDEDPARMATAEMLGLPAEIMAVSQNGMLRINVGGQPFWVISDDVQTTMERAVDAACDPKVAGKLVAHGKRGASEGCQ